MATTEEEAKADAWAWVKNVDPLNVTEDHMVEVYNLRPERFPRQMPGGTQGSVLRNPFWIGRLGEKKWLRMTEGELLPEDHEDYNRSILKIRNPTEFAGLVNCGNTCYVNSIFQPWFHNPLIRQSILDWKPPKNQNDLLCPLIELQKLFARMKYSKMKSIDTKGLINSLNLNDNSQQDAQEFSLLFTEKLIRTLDKYAEPKMKERFETLFQGEAKYETKCSCCDGISENKEEFTELKVGMGESFHAALSALLQSETFAGEDQISCSNCDKKVDATRTMKITKFPVIFQLQIMRYVFNRVTCKNEKIKENFNYPENIDLSEFLHTKTENEKYHIHAAVMHVGSTTESGHYFVKIRDLKSGQWHEFSDERVAIEEAEEESSGDQVTTEPPKEDIPKSISSGEVCMLIYIKDGEDVLENKEESEPVKQQKIDIEAEDDEAISITILEHMLKVKRHVEVKELFFHLETRHHYPVLDEHFISYQWMKNFIKEDVFNDTIDNRELLCPHSKVRPLCTSYDQGHVPYRIIPSKAATSLYLEYSNGPPQLKVKDSMCRICVQIKCKQLRAESQLKLDFDDAKQKLKEFDKVYSLHKKTKNIPDDFYKGKRWLHTNFVRKWKELAKKSVDEMTCLDFKKDVTSESKLDLICNQNMLQCCEGDRKLIPEEVWVILVDKYFVVNFDFSADKLKPCPSCEKTREKNAPVLDQNKTLSNYLKEKLSSLLKGENRPTVGQVGNFFLVPQSFVLHLKSFMETPSNMNPPHLIENKTLQCIHGKLGYPVFHYEISKRIEHALLAQEDEKLAVLREPEWDSLKSILSYDYEIRVTVDGDRKILQKDFFCNQCGTEWWEDTYKRRLDFKDENILIKLKEPSKEASNSKQPKTEQSIKTSGEFYVFQLKNTVQSKFKIPSINQRLTLNDVELTDAQGNKMLKDFGVLPGATIFLEIIPDPKPKKTPNALEGLRI